MFVSGLQGTRDLYWAIGDGGGQEDPDGRGGDLTNILASIVRVRIPAAGDDFDLSPSGNVNGCEELFFSFLFFSSRARTKAVLFNISSTAEGSAPL